MKRTAALLYGVRPAAAWSDLVDLLKVTAEEIDTSNPAYAGELGSGVVSPQAAVAAWWAASGDVDASGTITSADIVYLINFVFKSGPDPTHPNNGDVDASCLVNAGDIIYLVNYVFKGGPAPQAGCVE